MDEKTLRTTVHQMYESAQSIAEKHPEQLFDTGDLDRVVRVAKGLYGDNDVIREMGVDEPKLQATDYTQKLAILKAQIDHIFAERASAQLRRR